MYCIYSSFGFHEEPCLTTPIFRVASNGKPTPELQDGSTHYFPYHLECISVSWSTLTLKKEYSYQCYTLTQLTTYMNTHSSPIGFMYTCLNISLSDLLKESDHWCFRHSPLTLTRLKYSRKYSFCNNTYWTEVSALGTTYHCMAAACTSEVNKWPNSRSTLTHAIRSPQDD